MTAPFECRRASAAIAEDRIRTHIRATEPVEVSKPIITPCLDGGTILVKRTSYIACAVGYPNDSMSDDIM